MPERGNTTAREVEVTLVVQAADRETVLAAIRDLADVGDYRLGGTERIDLRDRYFDTPAGDLCAAGFALRVRRIGETAVLALKGRATVLPGAVLDRFESEAPWSASFLSEVLEVLRSHGVPAQGATTATSGDRPERVLESVGLLEIHARTIARYRRDAVRAGGGEDVSRAEVVLDTVRFEPGGREVVHHEIEIEGRGPDAGAHAAAIATAMVARFGTGLRRWPFGKLTTGRALESLAEDDRLEPLLDDRGRVGRDGYDVLEATIRSWDERSAGT